MTTPTTVPVRLQLRADTAANWTSVNPILLANELGRETDTGKIKIGNGTSTWTSLAYQAWATLPVAVNAGGTGQTSYTNGQLLIGNTTGNTLTKATLTAGSGVAITNGTGSITVAASGIANANIAADAEIAVSKLQDGTARQLLQTAANGTDVEWASNIDIPGTLDVTGNAVFDANLTVQGDLTVNGTETIINTQTLTVEDKNIELGKITSPTDVTADGGGITLKGTTDKTINWIDATDAWTLSEHVDLATGKEYRINGAQVLTGTGLGSGVTSSSLTSVGTIGTGIWQGTAVGTAYGGTGQTTYTNGQLLIGKTDGTLAKATLTAGTGVAVTNADGSITVAVDSTVVTTAQTGTVTSTMIADGTIVDADVNASAAIAGTKISPNFGSQNVVTTGTSTAASLIPTGSSVPTNGVYLPAANSVGISTNGTGRLFVDASGNVGIGAPRDTGTLDVRGIGRFLNQGASSSLEVGFGTTTSQNAFIDLTGDTTYTDYGLRIIRTNSGANAASQIQHRGTGNLVVQTQEAADITFLTTNVERARITSEGRLGLGTSSPSANLTVQGISGTYPTAEIRHSILDVEGEILRIARTDVANIRYHSITAQHSAVAGGADNYLAFKIHNVVGTTAQTEVLRLTGNGRVGIGTTSPGAGLHIVSTGQAAESLDTSQNINLLVADSGNSPLNGGSVVFGASNGAWRFAAIKGLATDGGNNTAGHLTFLTRNASTDSTLTERLRINANGRIGIGTNAPGGRLGVKAETGEVPFLVNGPSSEFVRIDSSGRLLVGTASDSGGALLQVNGDRVRIATAKTPASSGATGTTGEIAWDADYIYVCTATNTWKRTAISTW
jgi:hypothetical protein